MHRVDNATAVTVKPASTGAGPKPNAYYDNDTIVESEHLNMMQEEIAGVIESAGLTLDKADDTQLLAALELLATARAGRGALVARTTAQSIPHNVYTGIVFDTANSNEIDDTDSIHDPAVNPTRFTVPTGVTKVRLSCSAIFLSFSGGGIQSRLRLNMNGGQDANGISVEDVFYSDASALTSPKLRFVSPIINVVAGDYFEFLVYQTSGAAKNIEGTATNSAVWGSMEIIK